MINNSLSRLQLAEIINRYIPGVTNVQAAQHMEACLICFDHNKHVSGVTMSLFMGSKGSVTWDWAETVDDHMRRSWKDLQDATECGATAIAILLVINFTEYTIIERSAKGTGFDYWLLEEELFDENDIFPTGSARLEVSGIIQAQNDKEIRSRVKQKTKQTGRTDNLGLPAIIVVVEFSRPEAHLVRKI